MNNFNSNMMGGINFNSNPNQSVMPGMGMNNNNYLYSGMNINNLPRYNIIQVHGQNGAEAFQMAPNSKVLLLDDNDPILWFVQTDGAGYKTITPYALSPLQQEPQIDLNSIEMRLTALEEKINAKSNTGTNKQRKSNSHEQQQPNGSVNTTNSPI